MSVRYEYFAAVSDEEAASVIEQGPLASVAGYGVEPMVQLGTLEELLTGRPFDDVIEDPRSGHDVAIRDGGERLVVTLTDALTAALAGATDDALDEVAVPWAATEEFWNAADPHDLAEFLKGLASLAREAAARGQRLYCWVCV